MAANPTPIQWVPKDIPVYSCRDCGCELALQDELISKSFSGRDGPAYLLRSVINIKTGAEEDKMLMTGLHTITSLTCSACNLIVGWKYLKAFDQSQRYKEGRFILEKDKIFKENRW